MTELCEVVITAPDPDWLYSFARALVEDRLAASAHNFTLCVPKIPSKAVSSKVAVPAARP